MRNAVLLLLSAAFLWSTGGILIKLVDWNPIAIAGMRSLIALPLLIFLLNKQKPYKFNILYVYGGICYALTVILFVISTKITTAANAIILQYTAPIYIIIFSGILLKERVRLIDIISIVIAFAGIMIFFLDKLSAGELLGNILALVTGITFAFLVIFLRMQKDGNPLISIVIGNILTVVFCSFFMFNSLPSPISWVWLIILGVFQVGLSYVLFVVAIKRVTALQGIMIPLIEPVLNPIWVFLFYGEVPGTWSIIGCIVVFVAVLVRSFSIINNSYKLS
ncbi:MAG: EamA family transporter [bacterium]|nr:EamA family transporter [bacterium]